MLTRKIKRIGTPGGLYINIPANISEKLGLKEGEDLEVDIFGDSIVLKRPHFNEDVLALFNFIGEFSHSEGVDIKKVREKFKNWSDSRFKDAFNVLVNEDWAKID